MKFTVINGELAVGNIRMISIAGSAVFLVGDVRTISLSSSFDTPPEQLIVGVTVGTLPSE